MSAEQAQNVTISDANLRAAVEARLGKTSGQAITVAEMETLTSLNARKKGITSLAGLEHAVNLWGLVLDYNDLSGNIDLDDWRKLRVLSLVGNDITGLSNLQNLGELRQLFVGDNDLTGLNLPVGIVTVSASRNQISSINLSRMGNLHSLTMSHNLLSELDVSNNRRLTILGLSHNRLTNISGLARLPDLASLFVGNNQLSGGLFLGDKPELEYLTAANGGMTSLHMSAPKLKTLRAPGNSDLGTLDLSGSPELEWVNVSEQNFYGGFTGTNLAGTVIDVRCRGTHTLNVTGLTRLKTLKMSFTLYDTITGVSTLTSLTELDMRLTCVDVNSLDVSALTNLETHRTSGSVGNR